jgi:photosystem II stability/assembly factor-like uncharacterized protein
MIFQPGAIAGGTPSNVLKCGYNPNDDIALMGGNANLISSVNGGQNWTVIGGLPVGFNPTKIIYGHDQTWIATGNSGIIWRTTNNGTTWTEIDTLLTFAPNLNGGVFVGDNKWIVVGANTAIGVSMDDGLTWTTVTDGPALGVLGTMYDVAYLNARGGILVAPAGEYILYSADLGESWAALMIEGLNALTVTTLSGIGYYQLVFAFQQGKLAFTRPF